MTRKAASKKPTPLPTSPLVPALRTLLHTLRCIAQHEDALCAVLHNLQSRPENTAELNAELRRLLDELPARDYIDDLDAVLHALSEPTRAAPAATE